MTLSVVVAAWRARIAETAQTIQTWPWLDTVRTLRERFRDDHLGLTASSLTFTTLIALVPLFTVMLALFSAFPMFAGFQAALERYFLQTLVPDSIARPVLGALTQFAGKAARLGTAGLVLLVLTALALVLTIDKSLNAIWRVRRQRSIARRVLIYWAAMTLGPLLLGVSLSLTSAILTASKGMFGTLPGGFGLLLSAIQFTLMAGGMAALFHYVPNTDVRWRHALAGGIFVAIGFELAKRGLAWYIGMVPTFSMIYGAFATLPIFLLWLYVGWVIVLWGAVIAAYAPSLSMHIKRMHSMPGHSFTLALTTIGALARARLGPQRGLALSELARLTRTDPLLIESVVDGLVALDWAARLDEEDGQRVVLLIDPHVTPARGLVDQMLLAPTSTTRAFRERAGVEHLMLDELLA